MQKFLKALLAVSVIILAGQLLSLSAYYDMPTLQEEFGKKYGNNNFISIQVQRSNEYLNWKSPSTALASLVKSSTNSLLNDYRHVFGHVTLVYGKNGVIRGYGETGDHQSEDIKLLMNGFGLTVFTNFSFIDGHLETDEEVNVNNYECVMERDGKFAWITFLVSDETVTRLENYINEFRDRKGYVNYAFTADAKNFQGAVCTTFVNAALEASGIGLPMIDKWVRNVNVPSKLMGFKSSYLPKMEWARYTGPYRADKAVYLATILATTSWAAPGTGEYFKMYDPELMYNACAVLENNYRSQKGLGGYKPIADNQSADALNLKSVLDNFYSSHAGKVSIGSLYETSGIVVDLR
jgi:hypothetical protein